jgi:hypothetical protein
VNRTRFTKSESSKGQTQVTGYSVVQADYMNVVKAMLTDHPHFMMPNASVEVFEMMPMQCAPEQYFSDCSLLIF